jgi:hypothetical protein
MDCAGGVNYFMQLVVVIEWMDSIALGCLE